MADRGDIANTSKADVKASTPQVYSIAAHRGFVDALVAGLVPRYRDDEFGLARLTLLLPSTRAQRLVSEAFIRHAGAEGHSGMLMPRMAVIGDLDLDEALGTLLDPLGAPDIPRAVDPTRRWLALARILTEEMGERAPKGATALRLARELAATMDRLLVEEIGPEELMGERVLALVNEVSEHWRLALRDFAGVQVRWLSQLEEWQAVDAATRRNALFRHAGREWRKNPPKTPIIAAGVTSAAPALASLLRVISELPQGAVILPDLDLSMSDAVWQELGPAGAPTEPASDPISRADAVTHPQYHLKLLLNRMGVARAEVQPWHRKGMSAARPERSHAISALFLPPKASRAWVELPAEKRRMSGVRIMQSAAPEEEAQAVAVLVREALEEPERRVAVVTPDRALARRVVQHLRRWEIEADDSAGRPLSQSAAGRVVLLCAELLAQGSAPVPLMALAMHPLVSAEMKRGEWLSCARLVERELRGPRPKGGLEPVSQLVAELAKKTPRLADWWAQFSAALEPLFTLDKKTTLDALLGALAVCGEALCGERLWAREDGRALARFFEDLRYHAAEAGTLIDIADSEIVLRDAMEQIAVRPPYGGHGRVAIYGLLESRLSRADLVICAGLNEGIWPPRGSVDALLAPPVLRALGVPGSDFRIGLSAHDLAGALGAPDVVLSRAARDEAGPTIPSRFLLRVQALIGEQLDRHTEKRAVELARALAEPVDASERYERPAMRPKPDQRDVPLAVTALDRLRGDPYQFYAQSILGLRVLDGLDADPSAAWQGEVAHLILERWHEVRRDDPKARLAPIMDVVMEEKNAHPLMRGLWEPRLLAALEWIENTVSSDSERQVIAWEKKGHMHVDGVRVHGRADRIDRLADGTLAIVDYKTGKPPSSAMVEQGFALQLGLLGMIARTSGFGDASGEPSVFEYWSLARAKSSADGPEFGYVETPLKTGGKRSGLPPEEFLPKTEEHLHDAITRWIKGDEPFTAKLNPDFGGYADYDQLMRLEEWLPRLAEEDEA
ncbi:double-strand break repair protein AddB [Erythrobacter sp. W53]|uniref:double-strand break repair protein AddB n=1 Tax=Erythrobacter sp. W53 TaxID=3425947 RepID=UPI003D767376